MKTTICHMVIEKLGTDFEFPEEVKGDLSKEHGYAMPILMKEHRALFFEVCDEVDKMIEQGVIYFNAADGIITQLG